MKKVLFVSSLNVWNDIYKKMTGLEEFDFEYFTKRETGSFMGRALDTENIKDLSIALSNPEKTYDAIVIAESCASLARYARREDSFSDKPIILIEPYPPTKPSEMKRDITDYVSNLDWNKFGVDLKNALSKNIKIYEARQSQKRRALELKEMNIINHVSEKERALPIENDYLVPTVGMPLSVSVAVDDNVLDMKSTYELVYRYIA